MNRMPADTRAPLITPWALRDRHHWSEYLFNGHLCLRWNRNQFTFISWAIQPLSNVMLRIRMDNIARLFSGEEKMVYLCHSAVHPSRVSISRLKTLIKLIVAFTNVRVASLLPSLLPCLGQYSSILCLLIVCFFANEGTAINEAATITVDSELLIENVAPLPPYNLTANSTDTAITLRWEPGNFNFKRVNSHG